MEGAEGGPDFENPCYKYFSSLLHVLFGTNTYIIFNSWQNVQTCASLHMKYTWT